MSIRLIVADTGPVNYLVLIGHIGILSTLFETVVLPTAVQNELASYKAPPAVRHWNADLPAWIVVRDAPLTHAKDDSLAAAFERLRRTSFRCPEEIMTRLLAEIEAGR